MVIYAYALSLPLRRPSTSTMLSDQTAGTGSEQDVD